MKRVWIVVLVAAACGRSASKSPPSAAPPPSAAAPEKPVPGTPAVHSLALPGAPPEGVSMDYLAYDHARQRLWVPAGNTGSVDVIDATNEEVTRIDKFATAPSDGKRGLGPSSVTIADRVAYVGSRADHQICEVDQNALKVGACLKLDAMPDGVAYVASTKEVWVTSPTDNTLVILDASKPGTVTAKVKIKMEGEPEGYAVDNKRGFFYTNLEDKDRTLAIDVKTRAVTHTWLPGCGDAGPRGLALDEDAGFLFVACTDHVALLDAGHDGKVLGKLDTGEGVDNIDYVVSRRELFAAAAHAARLTIAKVDDQGQMTPLAAVATATGARNAIATDEGVAYVPDGPEGKLLVVTRPAGSR